MQNSHQGGESKVASEHPGQCQSYDHATAACMGGQDVACGWLPQSGCMKPLVVWIWEKNPKLVWKLERWKGRLHSARVQ